MDEKMYYERKPIKRSGDVKAAYEYAVAHNIKYYRGVSEHGTPYFWTGKTHQKLPAGQWAENPHYKDLTSCTSNDVTSAEVTDAPDTDIAVVEEAPETTVIEQSVNAETEEKPGVANVLAEKIKSKIEERLAEVKADIDQKLSEKNARLDELRSEVQALTAENTALKTELANKSKEYDKIVSELSELEEAVTSITLV